MLNKQKSTVTFTLLSSLLISHSAHATYKIFDARTYAMGGVTIVASDVTRAAMYNPGLLSIVSDKSIGGMTIPSLGYDYDNPNHLTRHANEAYQQILAGDTSGLSETLASLDGAVEHESVSAALSVGAKDSTNNPWVESFGFYTVGFASQDMAVELSDDSDATTQAQNSRVNTVQLGGSDFGFTVANKVAFAGQQYGVGITTKLQKLRAYSLQSSVADYGNGAVKTRSRTKEEMINFDAGVAWESGPFRAGITAINLIPYTIKLDKSPDVTSATNFNYKITPQFTTGVGVFFRDFELSADYDLNQFGGFNHFDDNQQWFRAGGSLHLVSGITLRGGYQRNYATDQDNKFYTAGVMLDILPFIHVDLAAKFKPEGDLYGMFANLTMAQF